MKNLFPCQACASVAAMALMLLAATAEANTLTYSLVPITYPDSNAIGNTDTLSGTIVVSLSGSIYGNYSSSNTARYPISLTANWTMSSAGSTAIAPISVSETFDINALIADGYFQRDGITIGPSSISLLNLSTTDASQSGLINEMDVEQGSAYIEATWDPWDSAGAGQQGYAIGFAGVSPNPASMFYEDTNADASPFVAVRNSWIVATAVPEPSSLAMAFAAALFAVGWRFPVARSPFANCRGKKHEA